VSVDVGLISHYNSFWVALLQNSVLAIPKAQWHERELKPFGINGNTDLLVLTKCVLMLNSVGLKLISGQLLLVTFYLNTDEGDTCYAKLLLASPDEVLKQVSVEVVQSLRLLSVFEYNGSFVKSLSTRLLHQKRQLLVLSL